MTPKLKVAILALLSLLAGNGRAETSTKCSGPNDVCWFGLSGSTFVTPDFVAGPKDMLLWSGAYWPFVSGGIGPSSRQLTSAQNSALTSAAIEFLSPAEKYDLARNVFDMTNDLKSLVKYNNDIRSAKEKSPLGMQPWEGICNGWSEAAIFIDPPKRNVTQENNLGQKIVFTPNDIKGLFSRFYEDLQNPKYRSCATPCASPCGVSTSGECQREPSDAEWIHASRYLGNPANGKPLTPSAFHIASTNLMRIGGLTGKHMMVADLSPKTDPSYRQIWNHPVLGFRFNYKRYTRGSRQFVEVTAKINYVMESVTFQDERTRVVRYQLELDSDGQIKTKGTHLWLSPTNCSPDEECDRPPPQQLWFSDTSAPSEFERKRMAAEFYPLDWKFITNLLERSGGSVRAASF